MAEYSYEYNGFTERLAKIKEAEAQGLVMQHDDFDIDWQLGDEPHGTLIFTKPLPPTDEELQGVADKATCEEYLAKSSEVIKMPEIWWLLRYFGKQLGLEVRESE